MSQQEPSISHLIKLFNQLFLETEKTELRMGADEPFYQTWKGRQNAVIFAREDYFSSALHEISHWTIAGVERRKLDDFGYWYEPEGRSIEQQKLFERVEVKPQAIEWLLSLACEREFNVSADNLSQNITASDKFKLDIREQALIYFSNGLPVRAQILFERLAKNFRLGNLITVEEISYV